MPFIEAQTRFGTVNFHYNISTPGCPSARSIDTRLPVILWLHPGYVSGICYHSQLGDPEIRKYNCITFDCRLHGETTSSEPVKTWGLEEAAEDVSHFMDALRLPPCHVVALSWGANVGLTLAQMNPQRVLSLFLMSPLSLVEPPDIAEGRKQVMDIWMEGMKDNDESAILDSVWGALQFAVSNHTSPFVDALVAYTLPYAIKLLTAENEQQFRLITCEALVNRQAPSQEGLAKIRVPIQLAYCGSDIAYKEEHVLSLQDALLAAGCKVKMTTIPEACHFGPLTHPQETSRVISEHLRSVVPNADEIPTPTQAVSPYENDLIKHGLYNVDSSSESDQV